LTKRVLSARRESNTILTRTRPHTHLALARAAAPLFPVLSRTRLDDKFRYLFAAVSISPLETFSYFVEWLVVAQLLENVLGAERIRRLFPLLLVVLPAKLLVAV
jgi:hypothetical protein